MESCSWLHWVQTMRLNWHMLVVSEHARKGYMMGCVRELNGELFVLEVCASDVNGW